MSCEGALGQGSQVAAAPHPCVYPIPRELKGPVAGAGCVLGLLCCRQLRAGGLYRREELWEEGDEIAGGWQSPCRMTQEAASTRNVACIKCKCQDLVLFHTLILNKLNTANCSKTISDLCVEQENLWTYTHTHFYTQRLWSPSRRVWP